MKHAVRTRPASSRRMVTLVAIATGALLLTACAPWRMWTAADLAREAQPYTAQPDQPVRRVLVVGDSTAVGTGANAPLDSLPGRIGQDHPKWHIDNLAANGVKIAYDLLVSGKGDASSDLLADIQKCYNEGKTDEFLLPMYNSHLNNNEFTIKEDDVVIVYNFRTDRPRQLTEVLTQKDYHEFDMHKMRLYYVTFSNYDQTFENIQVVFEKDNLNNTLGQVISEAGLTQVRIAETEKYPHVTFFFNGGVEEKFVGEDRIMVPSPKVPTYDLKPEMSAIEITEQLITYIEDKKPNFICLNYANADMVGHTGVFAAAVKAVETVDTCLGRLLVTLSKYDYQAVIIADHGNSDLLVNPDGSPNTAHTTNPVPVIFVGNEVAKQNYTVRDGKLGDLAPSILSVMGITPSKEMTGDVIIVKK